MIIDLLHNKIVADIITEGFQQNVREVLVPKLVSKYGDALLGIQMYEDYISDKLLLDGEWYYPLTVIVDGEPLTQWIKWSVDKKRFSSALPYAYIGEGKIDFTLCDEAPAEFVSRLVGRAYYYEPGLIKVKVETTATDPTFLSGKYSQTFVDEMARQLTKAIEKNMQVSGLSGSVISLSLVFAPESYMEHTSENVTYRRLLLSDKTSAPRDLWVKWTRVDGEGAYTVADSPASDAIVFEIGESVSQKIREKEYRFLLRACKDDYHRAMGRKNMTEWRDLIKRALRRGELTKLEIEAEAVAEVIEISEETKALNEQLAAVLGIDTPVEAKPTETVIEFSEEDDGEFARAMRLAREAVGMTEDASEDADVADGEELIDEEDDEDSEEEDELEIFYREEDEAPTVPALPTDAEEEAELDEITKMAMEALRSASITPDKSDDEAIEVSFEPIPEESTSEELAEVSVELTASEDPTEEYDEDIDEIEDEESLEEAELSDALEDVRAIEPDEEPISTVAVESAPVSSPVESREAMEEKIRLEVEAKLRLEYESRARERAEEEAAKLRREQEELRIQLEKLQAAAKIADAERAREIEAERTKQERMRIQIEQQMRAEAKERERLAEAAMLALEEKRRLEEEKLAAERKRLEEERLAAEERARKEEAERIEAERAREAERIRREAQERAEAAKAQEANKDTTEYTSKVVKLIFRRSVDPGIIPQIYEKIKETVAYYGKESVNIKIKASNPDVDTVVLDFVQIPKSEMELLSNIIKVLGNSNIGIAKAVVE